MMTDVYDASSHLFCQAKRVSVCRCFQCSPVTTRKTTVKLATMQATYMATNLHGKDYSIG